MKQPTKETIIYGVTVWKRVDHTATGGFTLDTTGLTIGSILRCGSMASYDESTRMVKVIPSAVVVQTSGASDTTYRISKNSVFTVGNNVTASEGGKAYPITAIDTSGSNDYDTITVQTTLGVINAGTAVYASTAAGAAAGAMGVTIKGLTHDDYKVEKGAVIDVVTHGVVYARRIPGAPVAVRTKLPLIDFSESF